MSLEVVRLIFAADGEIRFGARTVASRDGAIWLLESQNIRKSDEDDWPAPCFDVEILRERNNALRNLRKGH